jgi:hypothetical protein
MTATIFPLAWASVELLAAVASMVTISRLAVMPAMILGIPRCGVRVAETANMSSGLGILCDIYVLSVALPYFPIVKYAHKGLVKKN